MNRKGFDSNTTTNRYLGEEDVYGHDSKSKRTSRSSSCPGSLSERLVSRQVSEASGIGCVVIERRFDNRLDLLALETRARRVG